jgi:hypothetical protein
VSPDEIYECLLSAEGALKAPNRRPIHGARLEVRSAFGLTATRDLSALKARNPTPLTPDARLGRNRIKPEALRRKLKSKKYLRAGGHQIRRVGRTALRKRCVHFAERLHVPRDGSAPCHFRQERNIRPCMRMRAIAKIESCAPQRPQRFCFCSPCPHRRQPTPLC